MKETDNYCCIPSKIIYELIPVLQKEIKLSGLSFEFEFIYLNKLLKHPDCLELRYNPVGCDIFVAERIPLCVFENSKISLEERVEYYLIKLEARGLKHCD